MFEFEYQGVYDARLTFIHARKFMFLGLIAGWADIPLADARVAYRICTERARSYVEHVNKTRNH